VERKNGLNVRSVQSNYGVLIFSSKGDRMSSQKRRKMMHISHCRSLCVDLIYCQRVKRPVTKRTPAYHAGTWRQYLSLF